MTERDEQVVEGRQSWRCRVIVLRCMLAMAAGVEWRVDRNSLEVDGGSMSEGHYAMGQQERANGSQKPLFADEAGSPSAVELHSDDAKP